MSKRLLLIIAGLIVAYAAIYFGDGMHVLAVADFAAGNKRSDVALLVILAALPLTLFGVLSWGFSMINLMDEDGHDDDGIVAVAALALVCLCCMFGFAAAPFTNYGAAPWAWASKWDVLPLLALVPTVLVVHDIVADIVQARRAKKASRENVIPLRRGAA